MTATRLALLGAALAPYIALVSIDAWMHERARKVPRLERTLHYLAAALFIAFLGALLRRAESLALVLFVGYAMIAAWDEIGFHSMLAPRERRVHFASYAALLLFLGVWAWIGHRP